MMTKFHQKVPFFNLFLILGLCWCTFAFAQSANHACYPSCLTVMSFNIENGGTQIDFNKVIEAIKKSNADVVGIQEPWGNIERLAQALHWKYFNRKHHIISRLPLLELPESKGQYLLVEVLAGKVVAMANIHLPSDPYGPERIIFGDPASQVIKMEQRIRLSVAAPLIKQLAELAHTGMPVFLTGDFNSPSHLDWTMATLNRLQNHRYQMQWPVSTMLEANGFTDSFRSVHPDPINTPGFTWPALRPIPKYSYDDFNPSAKDPTDRIDFIFVGGQAQVMESHIIGEEGSKEADMYVTPWPSDHRAVVSKFKVNPLDVPDLISVSNERHIIGEPLLITYYAKAQKDLLIELVSKASSAQTCSLAKHHSSFANGKVIFRTEKLKPGAYIVYLKTKKKKVLSHAFVQLVPKNALPSISVSRKWLRVGEPFKIVWKNAPGNRYDYVRISRADKNPLGVNDSIYHYTRASINGSIDYMKGNWSQLIKPLPPATYDIKLMLDDGETVLAKTTIEMGQ